MINIRHQGGKHNNSEDEVLEREPTFIAINVLLPCPRYARSKPNLGILLPVHRTIPMLTSEPSSIRPPDPISGFLLPLNARSNITKLLDILRKLLEDLIRHGLLG